MGLPSPGKRVKMGEKKKSAPTVGMALKITVSPTANGNGTYVQIMSADGFSINVVLIAESVEIQDAR